MSYPKYCPLLAEDCLQEKCIHSALRAWKDLHVDRIKINKIEKTEPGFFGNKTTYEFETVFHVDSIEEETKIICDHYGGKEIKESIITEREAEKEITRRGKISGYETGEWIQIDDNLRDLRRQLDFPFNPFFGGKMNSIELDNFKNFLENQLWSFFDFASEFRTRIDPKTLARQLTSQIHSEYNIQLKRKNPKWLFVRSGEGHPYCHGCDNEFGSCGTPCMTCGTKARIEKEWRILLTLPGKFRVYERRDR